MRALAYVFCAVVLLGTVRGDEEEESEAVTSLQSVMQNIKLFSVSCADDESQYSDWTKCVFPHGDLGEVVRGFVHDAREKGCQVPPRPLVKLALRFLKNSGYDQHPLYKKIPSAECGFCGRKTQCCKKARSFLTQSFRGDRCSVEGDPCEITPLTEDERDQLQQLYPDITPPEDACNFSPYTDKELARLRATKAFPYVKPLFCQILGTSKPSISCASVDNKCFCCCMGYKYQDGECVPDESAADPDCAADD